ncbi:MAG: phosphoribosylanthranilate isomerase [Spongiibacteraceae bacterium]|nr:phosphoribosylanthranilate isomerase [Spongiibacteraceae bacterium]
MRRTRVKICGITRSEDALAAVAAGADAIGLVFWEPSSRAVSIEQAAKICAQLPVFVSVVALIVNAERERVEQIIDKLPISVLQFHGDESPDFCRSFKLPYIKAIRVRPELDLDTEIKRYRDARGMLLDAFRKGMPGGTGESFDWELIPKEQRSQIILAGGLNADNVQQAVIQLRPFAVDVSGGLEFSPGQKDSQKISEFIRCVNKADQSEH